MEAILDRAYETDATVLFGMATDFIGPKVMASDLDFHVSTVYKMAASKKTNGETRKSPLIYTAIILINLAQKGNRALAVRIVDFFCRLLDGRFVPNKPVRADKTTLSDELLDNLPALSIYTETMKDPNATMEEKRAAKRALFDEIEQDFDESLK